MLTYPMAVQAIAALEDRAADFERRLAQGTALPDTAEMVIRDALAASRAIRHEFGLTDSLPDPDFEREMQALERMFRVSVEADAGSPNAHTGGPGRWSR